MSSIFSVNLRSKKDMLVLMETQNNGPINELQLWIRAFSHGWSRWKQIAT